MRPPGRGRPRAIRPPDRCPLPPRLPSADEGDDEHCARHPGLCGMEKPHHADKDKVQDF